MDTKLKKLSEIFSIAFDVDIEINEYTSKENEILWDSINHLNLIVELESSLNITFTSEEIETLDSVGKLIFILNNKNIIY